MVRYNGKKRQIRKDLGENRKFKLQYLFKHKVDTMMNCCDISEKSFFRLQCYYIGKLLDFYTVQIFSGCRFYEIQQ